MSRFSVVHSQVTERAALDGISENHHLSLPSQGIFALADGLGGPQSGRQASKLACEGVVEFLKREAGDRDATLPFVLRSYFSLPGNILFNSLIHANRKVVQFNQRKSVHEKGAASVIAGFLDRDVLALAMVGSVSAWLLRAGQVRELVTPRSWGRFRDPIGTRPAEWVDQLPLAALGLVEDLEPEIVEFRLQPGDRLEMGSPAGPNPFSQLNQGFNQNPGSLEWIRLTWEFQ